MYSSHPAVNRVQDYITMLSEIQKRVLLVWVPGHLGIEGNRLADLAAKSALTLSIPERSLVTPRDISLPWKEHIKESWQAMWDESPHSKLKLIKRTIKAWKSSERNCRREEVILTRLRIGHTRTTHGYLISKDEPPKCPYCRVQLSVQHMFSDCRFYQPVLQRHKIPIDVTKALADDPSTITSVINFIRDVSLYESI